KSIQRSVTLDRDRLGGGLPAPIETERRSQTENGGTPGDQRAEVSQAKLSMAAKMFGTQKLDDTAPAK
ncbi:MAG: hypothetical protein DMF60_17420, partial [Acidobacteria bacterium]